MYCKTRVSSTVLDKINVNVGKYCGASKQIQFPIRCKVPRITRLVMLLYDYPKQNINVSSYNKCVKFKNDVIPIPIYVSIQQIHVFLVLMNTNT